MSINNFRGEHWFLSNFFPVRVVYNGMVGGSAEHLFQAVKSPDPDEQQWVLSSEGPWQAKKRGRQVRLRSDWDTKRVDYMYDIVKAKFEQNAPLRKLLIKTAGQELVEGNKWGDTFWGVSHGQGDNNLGKILMRVRDELT